ncbi:hypothetical protein MTR67_029331 [Solanum verrucosum]|uniref:Uncharacterized protein n=1 Tax=Solanum verrucosum TaxID=315347 RepID=A0AAF0TX65_SOLVR|nr:hypothetical protein MTR67_029331 [Solanum verrucosum]
MSHDPYGSFSSISSALEKAPIRSSASSVSSADQSQLLLTRSSKQAVSQ